MESNGRRRRKMERCVEPCVMKKKKEMKNMVVKLLFENIDNRRIIIIH